MTAQAQNQYLGYLIDVRFQGVNRCVVLSYTNIGNQSYKRYFLPTVQINDENVVINERDF